MTDEVKRFEIVVLRPLQVLFVVAALTVLFKGMWLLLTACIFGLFYLGIIGAKLHPSQSARDLAQGPLEGPAAAIESALVRPEVKRVLVGHACTRVGILIGLGIGAVLWATLDCRWYFVLLVVLPSMLLAGALLKVAFRTS